MKDLGSKLRESGLARALALAGLSIVGLLILTGSPGVADEAELSQMPPPPFRFVAITNSFGTEITVEYVKFADKDSNWDDINTYKSVEMGPFTLGPSASVIVGTQPAHDKGAKAIEIKVKKGGQELAARFKAPSVPASDGANEQTYFFCAETEHEESRVPKFVVLNASGKLKVEFTSVATSDWDPVKFHKPAAITEP